jgi:hypothetical protein
MESDVREAGRIVVCVDAIDDVMIASTSVSSFRLTADSQPQ